MRLHGWRGLAVFALGLLLLLRRLRFLGAVGCDPAVLFDQRLRGGVFRRGFEFFDGFALRGLEGFELELGV